MAKLHKIEMYILDIEENYGTLNNAIDYINDKLELISLHPFNIQTLHIDWHDGHVLNSKDATYDNYRGMFPKEDEAMRKLSDDFTVNMPVYNEVIAKNSNEINTMINEVMLKDAQVKHDKEIEEEYNLKARKILFNEHNKALSRLINVLEHQCKAHTHAPESENKGMHTHTINTEPNYEPMTCITVKESEDYNMLKNCFPILRSKIEHLQKENESLKFKNDVLLLDIESETEAKKEYFNFWNEAVTSN